MMHSIDKSGVLIQVSNFWAEKLGYSPDEMIGKKSSDFLMPESQRYAIEEVLPKFFAEGRIHNVNYQFRRGDGTPIDVLMSAVAQVDADGHFLQSLAILFDNTEAKRAMAMLHQKQRSESIGRLVGGVAHDFNNALSIIQGSLELLQDFEHSAEHDIHLMDAMRATRRAATMTRQLLSLGRQTRSQSRNLDLNDVVRSSVSILGRLMPETIEVEATTNSGLWPVRLDRHQLDTAILNIANNSRNAMETGGKLMIETSNIRLREEHQEPGYEPLPAGRYVMLAISDTGAGIPRDIQSRIFEPYFTTSDQGDGTGMGLAMVQNFVTQSKGAVRVHSEEGFGTSLKIYFPAAGAARPNDNFRDGIDDEHTELSSRAEVLIVEDEDDVRKILAAQLKAQGYSVAQATNGDFALTMLEAGFQPRILITDVVMPGRNQGPELAAKAREIVPNIKIVYISGYEAEAYSDDEEPDARLIKPVSRSQLSASLKALVN